MLKPCFSAGRFFALFPQKGVCGLPDCKGDFPSKQDIANMVRTVFEMAGANVSFGDGYPGWKPNPHSEILEIAAESYKRLFGVDAKIKAIHAGLECGLFLDKYPSLDMISFGPTLQGVHSPDERMLIPTVQKFWDHLLDILKHIPAKH